jgi:hypothetical protein
VPGECPTGRRSLAGGPRHPYKRLGSCWCPVSVPLAAGASQVVPGTIQALRELLGMRVKKNVKPY